MTRTLVEYLAGASNGDSLLDMGCGVSGFPASASAYFNVQTFDLSEHAVRMVHGAAGLKWVGTATALPLRDQCMDVVTCIDVIEHLADPVPMLDEAHRVLRRGGVLLIRTPNPKSLGLAIKRSRWFGSRDPTHQTIKSLDEWTLAVASRGFEVISSGSDTLWDPPYFSQRPNVIERAVFLGQTAMIKLVTPFLPWKRGENTHLLARKS